MATTARIIIRVYQYHRLLLDDYFLLFACVLLCAGTGVLYHLLPMLYFYERLNLNPTSVSMGSYTMEDLFWYQKMVYSYVVLSWASIFAVKFSFLFFFRTLIQRVSGGLFIYWKVVLVTTIITGCFNTYEVFISCPHFNLAAREWLCSDLHFKC